MGTIARFPKRDGKVGASESSATHGGVAPAVRAVFEKRLSEGYVDVAPGSGSWVKGARVAFIHVFYAPDGRIATHESFKFSDGERSVRATPEEHTYDADSFALHAKEWNLDVGRRESLSSVVNSWK